MNRIVVIKASLNPESKSAAFAQYAVEHIKKDDHFAVDYIDLCDVDFSLCDGGAAYSHPDVSKYKQLLENCSGVFIAAPIYNYDVNAALKNFIEMTGQSWKETVVGLSFYAGGERSYMSPLSLINSLILDFRCLILPNYVYVSDKSAEDKVDIDLRLNVLLKKLMSLSQWQKDQLQ